MRYLSIISLLPSADGDQPVHFYEKEGETMAPKVSSVLLQTGPADKRFLATHKYLLELQGLIELSIDRKLFANYFDN